MLLNYFICLDMFFILLISGILLVAYCSIIMLYTKWFRRLKPFVAREFKDSTTFSVIIPARDEEQNIANCLRSIIQNKYDRNLLEIIVIDDNSTDKTAQIVQEFQQEYSFIRMMAMKELVAPEEKINSYKKLAIEKAVALSKGNWIVTTDADCIVPVYWLRNFNAFIQEHNSVFIAAPVRFINSRSFLSIFQALDFLSLQGITAASVSVGFHSMCNGANLCYKKEAFFEVDGFKGFEHLASGDDMFLMRKIQKKYPGKTHYIFSQDSIVATLPMPTIKTFINQRIRWASKADSYDDKKVISVLFLVYFFNLSFLILFVAGLFNPLYFLWMLAFMLIKIVFEMNFMRHICHFFQQKEILKYFPAMEPFHILYTLVSGWLGKFGKYQWKGRRVN